MKKLYIIFTSVFIAISLFLGVYTFISSDRNFSENENRTLKTKNDISRDFFSGNTQKDINTFLSDQFPLRDMLVSASVKLKLLLGNRDINGTYIGENRYLQKITNSEINLKKFSASVNKVNTIAKDSDIKATLMYIPSAGISLKNELPKNAEMYDYSAFERVIKEKGSDCSVIDLKDVLTESDDYYKTDHHWTTTGVYKAYCLWQKEHNRKISTPEELQMKTVSEDFLGSLYSKAPYKKITADEIKMISIPENLKVVADGNDISIYQMEKLKEKDKYAVFFGGNYGIVSIENPDCKNDEVLVVSKDSFANSFIPFIVNDYSKIVMIDDRYSAVSISQIAEEESATEIAVIKEIAQVN